MSAARGNREIDQPQHGFSDSRLCGDQALVALFEDFFPGRGLRREDCRDPRAVSRYVGRRTAGANDYVLSADEKTSIQARVRGYDSLPVQIGRPLRVESESVRGGALQYLTAWDEHRVNVFGRCESATGILPFGLLFFQQTAMSFGELCIGVFSAVNRLIRVGS